MSSATALEQEWIDVTMSELQHQHQHEQSPLTVLLMGKTGSGKSSVGNMLLGRQAFEVVMSYASNTSGCITESVILQDNRQLTVTDTRGLMDTEYPEAALDDLAKAVADNPEGYDALMLTIRLDIRLTREESDVFQRAVDTFGSHLYKYMIVVFTHGDDMKNDEIKFKEHIDKGKENFPQFKNLMLHCENNRVMVDNSDDCGPAVRQQQKKGLIEIIDRLASKNEYRKYTNELFQMAKKLKEERKLKAQEKEEEIRLKMEKLEDEYKSKIQAETSRLKKELEEKKRQLYEKYDQEVEEKVKEKIKKKCFVL